MSLTSGITGAVDAEGSGDRGRTAETIRASAPDAFPRYFYGQLVGHGVNLSGGKLAAFVSAYIYDTNAVVNITLMPFSQLPTDDRGVPLLSLFWDPWLPPETPVCAQITMPVLSRWGLVNKEGDFCTLLGGQTPKSTDDFAMPRIKSLRYDVVMTRADGLSKEEQELLALVKSLTERHFPSVAKKDETLTRGTLGFQEVYQKV